MVKAGWGGSGCVSGLWTPVQTRVNLSSGPRRQLSLLAALAAHLDFLERSALVQEPDRGSPIERCIHGPPQSVAIDTQVEADPSWLSVDEVEPEQSNSGCCSTQEPDCIL